MLRKPNFQTISTSEKNELMNKEIFEMLDIKQILYQAHVKLQKSVAKEI